MNPLGAELQQARKNRKMSLTDIADQTLINPEFLANLEEGNFTFLPRTYVRAFLREYAACVGLDPDEVLRRHENAATEEPASPRQEPSGTVSPTPEPSSPVEPEPAPSPAAETGPATNESQPDKPSQGAIRIALSLLLVFILAAVAWNLLTPDSSPSVEEIPFESVMKEHEQRDQVPGNAPAETDSLILQAVTRDTVWILISVDGGEPIERLMRPGTEAAWKAAERFVLSVGNAGAVDFTLNEKPLKPLGKTGVVTRNRTISREDLENR